MSSKVINTDFFKKKSSTIQNNAPVADGDDRTASEALSMQRRASPIRICNHVIGTISEASEVLAASDQKPLAAKLLQICKDATRERFSIAVVGEFSKGKSTFINALLGRNILPVGDLPTTAMVTRVRYHPKELFVLFDEQDRKVNTYPLMQSSWDGLTADNFGGNDPKGTVLAGVNSRWLGENNIEIMDTPGAGDLEETRSKVIGEALLACDSAIITISATAALSHSEKLFIEQRLLSRKTPFLMILITKLDQVPMEQRAGVIDYVKNKLFLWKMDIPVFVPYQVDIGDETHKDILGMDKIKDKIISWINDPQRIKLTEEWIASGAIAVIDTGIAALKEQQLLFEADDMERLKLIQEKKQQLSKAEIVWEELRLQMLERCNCCYTELLRKVDDYRDTITERLQYEAAHTNNPQKWWTEDYTYRLKVELTNMAVGVENVISRIISEDARWFNTTLDKQFKTHVLFEKDRIADKELFGDVNSDQQIIFENIDKKRNISRIGTTALSIAGAIVLSASGLGFLSLIATLGVGTGASIISESVFKGKLEKQKEDIKAAIAKNVPEVIMNAITESEKRLKAMYDDIIHAAVDKEKTWLNAQKEAIENSIKPKNTEQKEKAKELLTTLEALANKLYTA